MAYNYINNSVRGSYIEYDYELKIEEGHSLGTTYQDYLQGKWILMTPEQLAFKEANPDASVKEVIEKQLRVPTPEELLAKARSNKMTDLDLYYTSSSIKSITVNGQSMWILPEDRMILKDRCNTALNSNQSSVLLGSLYFSPIEGIVIIDKIIEYEEKQKKVYDEKLTAINSAKTVEEEELIDVLAGWEKPLNIDAASLKKEVAFYESKSASLQAISFAKQVINNFPMAANEALEKQVLFPVWGDKNASMGKPVEVGFRFNYKEAEAEEYTMFEVIQKHELSSEWVPGITTASLYKVVQFEHTGTIEDPIPWVIGMELFKDKYYTEDELLYKCIRNSEIAMSYRLSDLISGGYVELVP